MTIVNFAVAMSVTRLARFIRPVPMLTLGILFTLVGMAWLSQARAGAGYLAGIGLPMLLIGAGQGLAFAPLTSFGISEVDAADAGAASGLLNTAHQLGSSVGLAILVAVAATAAGSDSSEAATVVDQTHAALTGSSLMLLIGLAVSLIVILPKERAERRAARPTTAAAVEALTL